MDPGLQKAGWDSSVASRSPLKKRHAYYYELGHWLRILKKVSF